MLPSVVANEVEESVKRFLTSAFPVTSPLFKREDGSTLVDDLLNTPGGIFKGPYLSIGLPFRKVTEQTPLPFKTIDLTLPPYRHQLLAYQRLYGSSPQSTVIATGTGSGKTECFMYPLLDHCANASGQGIKAIIIYPMNALAADQARRFAKEIYRRENLRGKVSVGLYVGENERSNDNTMGIDHVIACKETLQNNPPDILLTNYKMLDFLLMRPKDQNLWRFNKAGLLRYLIVDELHTFDGAQGTDLACLIRRLRDKLDIGDELACVGTSATMGGDASIEPLIEYVNAIFATEFINDPVILEDRLTITEFLADTTISDTRWPIPYKDKTKLNLDPKQFHNDKAYLQAQVELWISDREDPLPNLLTKDKTEYHQACIQLGECLKRHEAFHMLLTKSNPINDIQRLLDDWPGHARTYQRDMAQQLLASLVALISTARILKNPKPDDPKEDPTLPFVQIRYQSWLRELRRVIATIEPIPQLAFADDVQDINKPLHFPVVHCRECYVMAWGAMRAPQERQITPDLQGFYTGFFSNHPDLCLVFPIGNSQAPERKVSATKQLCANCGHLQNEPSTEQCGECRHPVLHRVWLPDMTKQVQRGEGVKVISVPDCPFCEAEKGLLIFGSRAISLGSVMINSLFSSQYNDDHKLIAFSDSVQDAAHRAGFIGSRTYGQVMRLALLQAIHDSGEGKSLSTLANQLGDYWLNKMGSHEAFVGNFIAPNMEWLYGYQDLQDNGKIPNDSDIVDSVKKRLEWELFAEFGLRSRLGRTLERTTSAVIYVDIYTVDQLTQKLQVQLQEELGSLRTIGTQQVMFFVLGLLWRLRTKGALYHPFLKAYIEQGGRDYPLNQQIPFMPNFKRDSLPAFVSMESVSKNFSTVLSKRKNWFIHWFNKCLAQDNVLATSEYAQAYTLTFQHLTKAGLLQSHSVKDKAVYSLCAEQWFCTKEVFELSCDHCGHRIQAAENQWHKWEGLLCQRQSCLGTYQAAKEQLISRDFSTALPRRLVPHEHSALLDSSQRKTVEESFIHGKQSWDVNLLSATPTLEMGIDIGNLSSVLLCAVPPGQANYLQRIGRAGRRDGNALTMTIANGHPHDLYFYADPMQMMDGAIHTPGVFLQAIAVLERQMIAFSFDRWTATGIDPDAIPPKLKKVLDGIDKQTDIQRFPHNFLYYVSKHRQNLYRHFLSLFPKTSDEGKKHLKQFIFGDQSEDSINYKIINRLTTLYKQRSSLLKRGRELKREIDKLSDQPKDEATTQLSSDMISERNGLLELVSGLNSQSTMNFLTDEGLLPNYAFPEEGVTLQSIIFRRFTEQEKEAAKGTELEGKAGKKTSYQFQRPAHSALTEFAPESHFYAVGHHVEIDQIDLNVSSVETWRLCDCCHYSENLLQSEDKNSSCPHCGSPQWADSAQRRTLIKLKQVFANANDRDSRIGDDSENRQPQFYNRQMLVDIPNNSATKAYRIRSNILPFGFEYIRKATFREINFGPCSHDGQEYSVAGDFAIREGFRICKHCGKVNKDSNARRLPKFPHAFSCAVRNKETSEVDYYNSLYLYRELESEAIRLLLPVGEVASSEVRLHSFIAAIHLGLKSYFKGDVGHLQVTLYSEPQLNQQGRRNYLVIYDTVPGGTGYLKQLMLDGNKIMGMLETTLHALQNCACVDEDDKDGCYSCLLAYRESRNMDIISRRAAEELLMKIIECKDSLEEVENIDNIDVNSLIESELEQRFIDVLKNFDSEIKLSTKDVNGKPGWFLTLGRSEGGGGAWSIEPQVDLGPAHGIALNTRADFVLWPARSDTELKPVVIYLDGFKYHYSKLDDDTAKRLAILNSGKFWVWSFSWCDLPLAGQKFSGNPHQYLEMGQSVQQQELYQQLAARGHWPDYGTCTSIVREGNLRCLIRYLRFGFNTVEQFKSVALSRMIAWSNMKTLQEPSLKLRVDYELQENASEAMRRLLIPGDVEVLLGGLMDAFDTSPKSVEITTSIPAPALKSLDELANTSRVHVCFDDREPSQDKDYESAWHGFWTVINLLQFAPKITFASRSGVVKGVYTPLTMTPQIQQEKEQQLSEEWQELLDLTDVDEQIVRTLVQANVTVPEVGFELYDEETGVLPQIELAWLAEKVAVIVEDDIEVEDIKHLRKLGWQVFMTLDKETLKQIMEVLQSIEQGAEL